MEGLGVNFSEREYIRRTVRKPVQFAVDERLIARSLEYIFDLIVVARVDICHTAAYDESRLRPIYGHLFCRLAHVL